MNRKMKRRVFLGITIGVLAAGPFAIRYFRRAKALPEHVDTLSYEHLKVHPQIVNTKLPAKKVEKAFEVFYQEREMWLKFRGLSAIVQFKSNNVIPEIKPQGGFVTLKLNDVNFRGDPKKFPYTIEMNYSKEETKESVLSTLVIDRNQNKHEIVGEQSSGVDLGFIAQLLTMPLETLAAFTDNVVKAMMTDLWEVVEEQPETIVFRPAAKATNEGAKVPELTFVNGHLRKFVSKQIPNHPYTTFYLEGIAYSHSDFIYPKLIRFQLDPNGKENVAAVDVSLVLSDIDVVTA
ncbi:MAG: hypothetical protein LBG58_16495 [Planctomycetaceae bacterium]|jgi:hypothetical protein|nr:hypothetical protein [Planctomycetaceae bacterium]